MIIDRNIPPVPDTSEMPRYTQEQLNKIMGYVSRLGLHEEGVHSNYTEISVDYTVKPGDYIVYVNTDDDTVFVEIPDISEFSLQEIYIKNIGANDISVNSEDNIDDLTSYDMTPNEFLHLHAVTEWRLL